MKSYCVKERKQTDNVPGSEHYVVRLRMVVMLLKVQM